MNQRSISIKIFFWSASFNYFYRNNEIVIIYRPLKFRKCTKAPQNDFELPVQSLYKIAVAFFFGFFSRVLNQNDYWDT